MKNRKCILVLGMHRSGTSALAGSLHLMGLDFGKSIVSPSFDNPKGFFENEKIQALNDKIFDAVGISWDSPGFLPENWLKNSSIKKLEKEAVKLLNVEFPKSETFVIKDPRICHLYPFWEKVLTNQKIDTLGLIILRSPLEIAQSLGRHFLIFLMQNYIHVR